MYIEICKKDYTTCKMFCSSSLFIIYLMCRTIYYILCSTTQCEELVVPGVRLVAAVLCILKERAHAFADAPIDTETYCFEIQV